MKLLLELNESNKNETKREVLVTIFLQICQVIFKKVKEANRWC